MLLEEIKKFIKEHPRYYEKVYLLNYKEIYDFIIENTQFLDKESSFSARKYCIMNDIKKQPVCKTCGKSLEFQNLTIGYLTYCSQKCKGQDKEYIDKKNKTCFEKYGSHNPMQCEKIKAKIKNNWLNKTNGEYTSNLQIPEYREKYKQTKLEKYGDENYTNRKKFLETWYNNKNNHKDWKEVWNNLSEEAKKDRLDKMFNTKLERYGNGRYVNPEKIKETINERYGVSNILDLEENKSKREEIWEKNKEEICQKIRDKVNQTLDKANSKREETNTKLYKIDNYAKTQQFKDLYKNKEFVNKVTQKMYETRKKNGTLNKSKEEDEIYDLLCKKYKDTKRNYHSELYPFDCDFYIPELDLYIEYNGHWTHGKEPFDINNDKHIKLVEEYKIKSEEINFKENKKVQYLKMIEVWTIRDVKKRKTAMKNNLNWIEFFNMDQFMDWYDKQ